MLLFDLEDFVTSGVVGPESRCISPEDWEDVGTTARATGDAFFKALNEWYLSTTACLYPEHPCYDEITKAWNAFLGEDPRVADNSSIRGRFILARDEFFKMMGENGGFFNEDICNKYRKALIDLKCSIRRLLKLIDDDTIGDFTPMDKSSQQNYFTHNYGVKKTQK